MSPTRIGLLVAMAGAAVPVPRALAGPDARVLALTSATLAQTQTTDPSSTFAAQTLPIAPVAGSVSLRATRATVWNETHAGRAIQRVLLERRVEVTLGGSRFEADRAVVWMRRLAAGETPTGSGSAWQVFVHLEDARALGYGESRIAADELPVGAIVITSASPALSADLAVQGPPKESLAPANASLDAFLKPAAEPARTVAPGMTPATPTERTPAPSSSAGEMTPVVPSTTPTRSNTNTRQAPVPPASTTTPAPQPRAQQQPATPPPITEMQDMGPGARPPSPPPTARPASPTTGADSTAPPVQPGPTTHEPTTPAPTADTPPPEPTTTTLIPQPVTLFPKTGRFSFQAGDFAMTGGEAERTLVLTGGVVMQFIDLTSDRVLVVQAQRAVAFLKPGSLDQLRSFSRDDVTGIYLEGAVRATDGQYSLNGPRVYYDVTNDRALIPEARLSTYDSRRGIPLIVRAGSVRQEGEGTFVATDADVANTTFAKPHFSVGAKEVTVRQYQRADGSKGSHVDADDLTLDARGVPYFYWPTWVGDPERFPLRSVGIENSNAEGVGIRSGWDPFTLTGTQPPEGIDAEVFLDVFSKRGFATGGDLSWDRPNVEGAAFAYVIPSDNGVDRMPSGEEIDAEGDFRGMITAEQRWELNDQWTLTTELAHVSDPRFVPGVMDPMNRNEREFTTRAHIGRRSNNSVLAIEAKSNLDDFIANDYLVQAPGYNVDRLPEVRYWRIADDPLRRWLPGWVVYHSEHRAGQLAMNFSDVSAASMGYPTDRRAQQALGIDADESVADRLRTAGLQEKSIWRGDSRHEFIVPLDAGPIRVLPFVVGRLTVYDTDFPAYAPAEDERNRVWGGAGVRATTTIQHVNSSLDSALFDLHQIRHIIEPGVTIWHADTNIDRTNLPEYDRDVEGIAEGSMIRAGVDQTWQTKRGGPGRWRSIDWLTLRTEWVWSSSDTDEHGPIGRWYEDKPELSNPGEFFHIASTLQLSEVVGLGAETTHDIDRRKNAYSAGGIAVRHGPDFSTSFAVRHVGELSSTFLDATAAAQLTSKYRGAIAMSYDPSRSDFQRIEARLERAFPNVILGTSISYNNISGETSFGIILRPTGFGEGLNVRGGDDAGRRGSGFGG